MARCAGCGAALGSWSRLRRQLERRVVLNEIRLKAAHGSLPRDPSPTQSIT
jgi:hypothetical protein